MRKKYRTLEEMRKALAVRQARWREKNRGYERIRAKNNYDKRRAGGDGAPADSDREEVGEGATGTDGEAVVHGGRAGDRGFGGRGKAIGKGETYTGPIEGVDTAYGPMEPKPYGGRGQSQARATSGGAGSGLDGAYPIGSELISSPAATPKPLGDAPGASLRPLTANEERTYARLEDFKARRARMEKRGVEVELIL
jgi:hypothetical protein